MRKHCLVRSRNGSFSTNQASWGVWSFASPVQDLGVVAEKRAERTRIYECSCTKYVSLHLVEMYPWN